MSGILYLVMRHESAWADRESVAEVCVVFEDRTKATEFIKDACEGTVQRWWEVLAVPAGHPAFIPYTVAVYDDHGEEFSS